MTFTPTCQSRLADTVEHPWLTVFTATYNRASTLGRTYKSLLELRRPLNATTGKAEEFEWVIVDDGSADDTPALVEGWCRDNLIPIRYFRQQNSGKHVALNNGARVARGYMFADLDSDDTYHPDAFKVFYESWNSLTDAQKAMCKGVTGRCISPHTGEIIGSRLPYEPFIDTFMELRYRYNVTGEMRGVILTELMRRYPFPTISEGSRFCPETIVWLEMARKYKELVVDRPVLVYNDDASDALTKGRSTNRARENFYLWKAMVNECALKYLRYNPKEMLKSLVGISRDGLLTSRSPRAIVKAVDGWREKLLVSALMPAGALLAALRR
ncbi:MAG: glycosyltransferase family 2 protein [Duncaniella sp.]|nr:glycosyltransferase family 2 protein [Duncaniella sp.]